MTDVLWCDWGRKERILETLRAIGKNPNFPMVLATGTRQASQKAEVIALHRDQYPADGLAAEGMRAGSLSS
jgi:hypothetical protein